MRVSEEELKLILSRNPDLGSPDTFGQTQELRNGRKPSVISARKNNYENDLAWQIKAEGLPDPELEFRFHPKRKWRFDLAWPDIKVAIEIEGGVWTRGRHTRGQGFIDDCEKYNEAALLGWTVIRVPVDWVKNGKALQYVERAIAHADRDEE